MSSAWQDLPEVRTVQRRSVRTLAVAQMLSSLGVGAGPSVGVLLAAEVTQSEAWAGIARASSTVGAALVALPLAAFAANFGRRRALAGAWAAAAVGAGAVALSAQLTSLPVFLAGMLLLGCGSAAGLQARFAGADLAPPRRRARTLSLVVWAGTFGAVLGPNLAEPGALLARHFGVHPFAGAFGICAVLLVWTALGVALLLRPDPLHLAQTFQGEQVAQPRTNPRGTYRRAWESLRSHPTAQAALVAQVMAHLVMVVIMTMTPVHLHHQGDSLSIIGLTISIHVFGMWGLAPLFGWGSDRWGPRRMILVGAAIELLACVLCAGFASSTTSVVIGLFLLGLGWSAVTVPAASLLTHAVPTTDRPYVQGFGDSVMNGVAALGAALSGPLMATAGFPALSVLSAIAVLPVAAAAVWGSRSAA